MASFGDMLQQFSTISKLAGDKNVQQVMAHPKVQKLLQDPEFQAVIKEKNIFKLMAHAEFNEIMRDPEIQALIKQVKVS